ncbi:MAG: Rid family hydrolase, partial [bacterium]
MEIVHTDDAPKAIGPYSQGVKHDGLIFISGQIPLDPVTGDIIKGDIQLAAEQAIKNFLAVLRSGGGKDVLKITLYLTDPDDFQAVNEVYG